jgi:hypothetical protein
MYARDNNGNILTITANNDATINTYTARNTDPIGTGDATGIWQNSSSDYTITNWNPQNVSDDMTNILQSLLIIGKMLKYFKENIQDDTMLKMIKEYEEMTDPYAIDEETIKEIEEIEDLYKL